MEDSGQDDNTDSHDENVTPYSQESPRLLSDEAYHTSASVSPYAQDGSSVEPYRNPEPPKELRGDARLMNADNVGDTVFSKHWLFTTLMNLIQTVDGHEHSKRAEDSEAGIDIDDSLQDDLCNLWDMSMNPEVVKFLQEFQALDILTGVIVKSRAPRATEICVGILGNMACNSDVCELMASNSKLVELLLLLFENPDAPTLVELTRLLHACISCDSPCSSTWVEHIKQRAAVFTHISFILQSSTNSDLLNMTGKLVASLLYADDQLCQQWASAELVLGTLESVKQLCMFPTDDLILNTADFVDKLMDVSEPITLGWSTGELVLCCLEANKQVGGESGIENVETFLHILQLVSTCESGVEALLSYGTDLLELCMKYLKHICDEEVIGLEGKENSIGSALSVINVLLASWEDSMKFLQEDYELIRCVLKILEEVFPHYNRKRARELRRMRRSRSVSTSFLSSTHSFSQSSKSGGTEVMNISHGSDPDELKVMDHKGQGDPVKVCQGHDDPKLFQNLQTESISLSGSIEQNISHQENLSDNLDNVKSDKHVSIDNGPSLTSNGDIHLDKPSTSSQGGETSKSAGDSRGNVPNKQGNNLDTAEVVQSSRVFEMLYDVIKTCIAEIMTVLKQILNAALQLQGDSARDAVPLGVPECLDYLDTKCPSIRIQYLIQCLHQSAAEEESQPKDPSQKLALSREGQSKGSLQKMAFSEESQSKDLLHSFQFIIRKYKLEKIEKEVHSFVS